MPTGLSPVLTPESFSQLVAALGREPPHIVGAVGEPAFAGAWANFDGDFTTRPARFFKDILGIVHLGGFVTGGAGGATGQTIFTLPAGYRPPYSSAVSFVCSAWTGAAYATGIIEVASATGIVKTFSGSYGAGTGEFLEGITFRAA